MEKLRKKRVVQRIKRLKEGCLKNLEIMGK